MNVLALTRYDDLGASSRVRFLQYIPSLARAGITVDVQPLFSNADVAALYDKGRRSSAGLAAAFIRRFAAVIGAHRADVIWLQQELFPFLPFALEAALLSGRKVVVDYDDAYHLYYQMHGAALARALFGAKIDRLMARADAVVVGSPTLAGHARAAGARQVHLVYSAVDSTRFAGIARALPQQFAVGWIGTPMTAAQSLHILREPLVQFLGETGARCLLMGVKADQFPGLKAERIPWSEAGETAFMARISAGLCPLDDSPWTRGKSGYKIIQYMAAGRATLASPVAIAGDLVVHGQTGFHCATADDWYRYLTLIHADAQRCAALGQEARRLAETRYDTAVAAEQLAGIFRNLVS